MSTELAAFLSKKLKWVESQLQDYIDEFEASKTLPVKDYQIISFRMLPNSAYPGTLWKLGDNGKYGADDKLYWASLENMLSNDMHGNKEIFSVRRLSDGEVFTVGDKVEYGSLNLKQKELKLNTTEIVSFGIVNNDVWAYGKNGFFISPLNSLSKLKQPIALTDEKINELVGMEKGFNIAREVYSNNPTGRIEYYDGDWSEYYPYKYKTFLDYQKQNK